MLDITVCKEVEKFNAIKIKFNTMTELFMQYYRKIMWDIIIYEYNVINH